MPPTIEAVGPNGFVILTWDEDDSYHGNHILTDFAGGLVKGGYTPDVIVVEAGKPIRLDVFRQESACCSGMMLVPAFNKSAKLPEGTTVPVEFLPQERGEFAFSCPTGMLRGNVIVE